MFIRSEVESTPTHVRWSTIVASLCFAVVCGLGARDVFAQNFAPNVDRPVTTMEFYRGPITTAGGPPGNKILLGGYFRRVGADGRTSFAGLEPDGTLFSPWNVNILGAVNSIISQPNGDFLISGSFVEVNKKPRNGIARLTTHGRLDENFNPNPDPQADGSNATIFSMAPQADGKIVVAGRFASVGGEARSNIARLNADGSLDTAFNPGTDGEIRKIALQADGKILVGGFFTNVGGQPRNRMARLNADGTVDMAFNPNAADSGVWSMAVQADGKIVVGGGFSNMGGQPRNRIARLNADGTLDATFNPDASDSVHSIVVQADGKIVIGGAFTKIGGQDRNRLAILNANGTVDAFKADIDKAVYAVLIQSDGKFLAAGDFDGRVARFNTDGTRD